MKKRITAATLLILLLFSSGAWSSAARFRKYYNQGTANLAKGKTREAVRNLEAAVSENPDSKEAFYVLGNAYRRLGRTDKAVDKYYIALDVDPTYKKPAKKICEIYLEQKKYKLALYKVNQYISSHKKDADFHYLKGKSLEGMKNPLEAAAAFRTAANLKPAEYSHLNNVALRLEGKPVPKESPKPSPKPTPSKTKITASPKPKPSPLKTKAPKTPKPKPTPTKVKPKPSPKPKATPKPKPSPIKTKTPISPSPEKVKVKPSPSHSPEKFKPSPAILPDVPQITPSTEKSPEVETKVPAVISPSPSKPEDQVKPTPPPHKPSNGKNGVTKSKDRLKREKFLASVGRAGLILGGILGIALIIAGVLFLYNENVIKRKQKDQFTLKMVKVAEETRPLPSGKIDEMLNGKEEPKPELEADIEDDEEEADEESEQEKEEEQSEIDDDSSEEHDETTQKATLLNAERRRSGLRNSPFNRRQTKFSPKGEKAAGQSSTEEKPEPEKDVPDMHTYFGRQATVTGPSGKQITEISDDTIISFDDDETDETGETKEKGNEEQEIRQAGEKEKKEEVQKGRDDNEEEWEAPLIECFCGARIQPGVRKCPMCGRNVRPKYGKGPKRRKR